LQQLLPEEYLGIPEVDDLIGCRKALSIVTLQSDNKLQSAAFSGDDDTVHLGLC